MRNCGRRNGAVRGFTLIELVVVLALVGLLSAVVVPRLYAALVSVTTRTQIEALVAQLDLLPYRCFALGVPVLLDEKATETILPDGEPILSLPDGWKVAAPRPIHYEVSGFCEGGAVNVTTSDGARYDLRVSAPTCRALLESDAPSG